MINRFYGKPSGQTFNEIVDQFSLSGINSVKTSTIPMLNYWKKDKLAIKKLNEVIPINGSGIDLCFEYPTPSYGSNKASMSDIMLLTERAKISIECKFTEVLQEYQNVKEWHNGTDNRSKVISHWLEILSPFIKQKLEINDIQNIPYQFLHRAASSCYQNEGNAYLVYQIFFDHQTKMSMENFIKNLEEAFNTLNPSDRFQLIFWGIEVTNIEPSANKENILQLLKERDIYKFESENFKVLN